MRLILTAHLENTGKTK